MDGVRAPQGKGRHVLDPVLHIRVFQSKAWRKVASNLEEMHNTLSKKSRNGKMNGWKAGSVILGSCEVWLALREMRVIFRQEPQNFRKVRIVQV